MHMHIHVYMLYSVILIAYNDLSILLLNLINGLCNQVLCLKR